MTSSSKLNSLRSLISPPEVGEGEGVGGTQQSFIWEAPPGGPTTDPFKHIPFLTEKASLKET